MKAAGGGMADMPGMTDMPDMPGTSKKGKK